MTAIRFLAASTLLVASVLLSACDTQDGFDASDLPPPTGNEPLAPEESRRALGPEDSAVKMTRQVFGKLPDGREVEAFTFDNGTVKIRVLTYGATLASVLAPDRDGNLAEVTLNFDEFGPYLERHPYFGSMVGRYANRIAFGKFKLRDKEYQLTTNNGPHHLHGGENGFDRKLWKVGRRLFAADAATLELSYESPDGEEGYPGNLQTQLAITVNTNNEIIMEFQAAVDAPTIVNLTNHAYWNLSGKKRSTILDHELTIAADEYLPVDKTLIPTGKLAPVESTPFDFRKPRRVGERIGEVAGDPGGYDHCFVLRKQDGAPGLRLAARLVDPTSGRTLEVLTTQPGLQFYSGNFLDGSEINGGFPKHGGLCLEAQHFPDSPNHPDFPSVVLLPVGNSLNVRPESIYHHTIVYRLGVAPSRSKEPAKEKE